MRNAAREIAMGRYKAGLGGSDTARPMIDLKHCG